MHIQTKTVPVTQGVNVKCSKTYINTTNLKHILCLPTYSINPQDNSLFSSALKIRTTCLEFDSRHRHRHSNEYNSMVDFNSQNSVHMEVRYL